MNKKNNTKGISAGTGAAVGMVAGTTVGLTVSITTAPTIIGVATVASKCITGKWNIKNIAKKVAIGAGIYIGTNAVINAVKGAVTAKAVNELIDEEEFVDELDIVDTETTDEN